jgi:uncharacterized protein (TIGR03067 family)
MRRVGILIFAVAVAIAPALMAQQKPADAAKGVPALQGTWNILTINGQSIADSGTTMTMEITGDKYAQKVNGEVNERGSIKVDASKKPMTIDFTITEGNDAGKPQAGLVDVTGDSMTMHLSQPGDATRPTSLSPQEGFFLVTAKKSK